MDIHFKLYLIKVLKRIKLLNRFNFHLITAINGVKVRIPFINGIGLSNFVLRADWLDSLILTLNNCEKKTFIDVGVNVGQTLIRLKSQRPKIKYIGFEPNSTCSSYAQQLIKVNNYQDCIIQNCALSNSVCTLILEKTSTDDSRASVVSSLRPDFFIDKEYVLALDYDSFYLDKEVSFIKIDVEGAELEVIKGMKLSIIKHQPVIVCEVLDSHDPSVFNFTQQRATQLSELLFSLNYSIIRLETSRIKSKIISFLKIDSILVKQWMPESYDFNDYLFYPSNKEHEVLINLSNICL